MPLFPLSPEPADGRGSVASAWHHYLASDRAAAFVKAGAAVYVGVATMGLSKRFYFCGHPGDFAANEPEAKSNDHNRTVGA